MTEASPHVLICTSPKAGSGQHRDLIPRLAQRLRDHGLEAIVTSDINELSNLARQHSENGSLKAVVAAGGDGTLSLVASHVPATAPILTVPLGTENLMAKHLGHGTSVATIAETILQNKTVRIDAGRADDRLFLLMCSAGFDAEVVRQLHSRRRGHIWKISYLMPTLRTLWGFRYPKIDVCDTNNPEHRNEARWAFVFNAPCYAMGLPIAFWANASDGWFDVVLLKRGSFRSTMRYIWAILRRRLRKLPDKEIMKSKTITLAPLEKDELIPYQLDGDFAGYLPVHVTMIASRVTLLVPPNYVTTTAPEASAVLDSPVLASNLAVSYTATPAE